MNRTRRGRGILVSIALFRLFKALLLVAAGAGALELLRPHVLETARNWAAALPFAVEHATVRAVIGKVLSASPRRKEIVAFVAFAYAALFVIEGTGLLLGKVWGEWLTIIATTSFIPFEVWEVVERPRPLGAAVLVANIAIVIYLIVRRRGAAD